MAKNCRKGTITMSELNTKIISKNFQITVICHGVRKKCRKVENHFLKLNQATNDNVLTPELKLEIKKLVDKEMKISLELIKVHFNEHTVTEKNGIVCTHWQPFDSCNKKYKLNLTSGETELLK
jgi:hypothetical protein